MIVNLTPHALTILAADDTVIRTIPASGQVARCVQTVEPLPDVDGVPAAKAGYGKVENLPEPEADVIYVVSGLVRAALPGRADLCSPGDQQRDPGNPSRIIGCRRLDF